MARLAQARRQIHQASATTVILSIWAATGSVSAARPGPISTRFWPGCGLMAATIWSIT